nr:malic acid transport protein [Quercus suber]
MFIANWAGLWLWGLALWFFLVSVGAHWSVIKHGGARFSMSFYSYIFPNTALTTATFAVGKALNNQPIKIIGCVMSGLLVLAWLIIFSMMIRAVILKDILWPQKQEDRVEGGWKGQDETDDSEMNHLSKSSEREAVRERKSDGTTDARTNALLRRGKADGRGGVGDGALGSSLRASDLCEERNLELSGATLARGTPEDMV